MLEMDRPYPATRLDYRFLSRCIGDNDSKKYCLFFMPFFVVDFPISLTIDTLLFPYDLQNVDDAKDKK